jgi:membrane-associated phospholipid phosphatase
VLVTVLLLGARPGFAQEKPVQPGPAPKKPPQTSPANPHRPVWRIFDDIASDFRNLPSWENAQTAVIGGGLALAAHPFDQELNAHLTGSSAAAAFFAPGKVLGLSPVQFAVAATTYAWGKARKEPKVVHLGVDLLRAQIVTQALTEGLKLAVRRPRPDGTNYSFPSGHASVTFATATVLERHLGWMAAVPTYTVASYVAASRLHDNRHYLSDVVFGAAVGLVGGRTVTRHGRDHWAMLPAAVPGGVGIVVMRLPIARTQSGAN